MTQEPQSSGNNGMPRWMIIAFAAKLVLVVAIVIAVVWWANA
ncbi:hypothetical protein [Novosphingobium naphthalenivorans]|nr:hypothetical protein [Novosphingobium naphthalenivorans]